MAHSRLECPHKGRTGVGLNHLPGRIAPPPCPDHRPILLSILLLVPARSRLHCLLLLHIVVLLVPFPLWLWTLLHLLIALKPRSALGHEGVKGDPHLLLGQLQTAPSGCSIPFLAV